MTTTTTTALEKAFAGASSGRPRHLGTRYDHRGRFLREPGNTVVCHLAPGSPSLRAVLGVREGMMALPGVDRLAFTVPSSLHMTLFQGIIEYRREWPYWPREMPATTPIEAMTQYFESRLHGFRPGPPFEMTVTDLRPTGLVLEGRGAGDRQALREWRDRLAGVFGYRHPDHDSYEFHITFAYLLDWLPDEHLPVWQGYRDSALARLASEAPVIALRPPAFCRFLDMNHFEELVVMA